MEKIKNNPLDINVSFLQRHGSKPIERNLHEILFETRYREQVEKIRNETDITKRRELKNALPNYTPSGLYNDSVKEKNLRESTGLICIDIDKKDNCNIQNFSQMKEEISIIPYIIYCGLSVGGEGYFCLIKIARPDKFKEHFKSIQQDFSRCGITIDNKCNNRNRVRFISYDSDPYINYEAHIYNHIIEEGKKQVSNKKLYSYNELYSAYEVGLIISYINTRKIDITEGYECWFDIACALANTFGENGRGIFHEVSQYNVSYDPDKADEEFNKTLKYGYEKITIATFFHYAKLANIPCHLTDFS